MNIGTEIRIEIEIEILIGIRIESRIDILRGRGGKQPAVDIQMIKGKFNGNYFHFRFFYLLIYFEQTLILIDAL